jgi:hypothetical protein
MADDEEYGEAKMIELQTEARQRAGELLAHVVAETHVSPAVLSVLLDAEIARYSLATMDAEAGEGLYASKGGAEKLALRRAAVQRSLDWSLAKAERMDAEHRASFIRAAENA